MRSITVPIDKTAADLLDYNTCPDSQLIELNLSDSEFNELWNIGLFKRLNSACNIIIDDFESEEIVKNKILLKGLKIVTNLVKENKKNHTLPKIEKLFMKAIEYDTGIYFYF